VANLSTGQDGYRPRRYYLIVGVLGATFFSTMGIVSFVAAYWNIDGSFTPPLLAAIIFGIFWSAMLLLSVWVLLAYFREHLIVDRTAITQHGILRSTSVRIADATEIKWRRIPLGGSIMIRTANRKIKIYFDNFAANQRDELIAFLHGTFAPEIQQGWSVFAESRVPSDPRRPQKSRAAAAVCALLLFAIGGILGYCWLVGLGVKWLVLGIVNALAGLWYVWRIWKFRVQPTTEETA
jgi:fatty acid desaturase